jgi:hypothetical protein
LELLLLGNICTLLGKAIVFDPVGCKIVNDEEADRALRPPRRAGWEILLRQREDRHATPSSHAASDTTTPGKCCE